MRSVLTTALVIGAGLIQLIGERETPEPPLAGLPLRLGQAPAGEVRAARSSESFVLTDDVLLMFDTTDDCIFTSSRLGFVNIVKEPGPLKVKAKFAQNPDRYETRTFAGKWVYTVEPVAKGECELLAWVIGETDEKKIQRFQVSVGGPRPPPEPKPPIPPTPDGKSPWPQVGFRVLIIYESSTLTTQEANVINSRIIRDYLDAKCVKGTDGRTPEYRVFDKDTTVTAGFWKDQLDKRRTLPTPRIAIGNGVSGAEVPLPPTVQEALELLRKYGGA